MTKCSHCSSTRIISNNRLIGSDSIYIGIELEAAQPLSTRWQPLKLGADICCDCGRIQLTAAGDLERFWQALKPRGPGPSEL